MAPSKSKATPRRSSARLQASQQSNASSPAPTPRKSHPLKENINPEDEVDSDIPIMVKRRKTEEGVVNASSTSSTKTTVRSRKVTAAPAKKMSAVEISTATSSTITSGAASPSSFDRGTETPATTVISSDNDEDDEDENNEDDEDEDEDTKPRRGRQTPARSAKGRTKQAVVIPDSEEGSEFDLSEPESEVIKPARSRKGKEKAIIPPSDGEDSDFAFSDNEGSIFDEPESEYEQHEQSDNDAADVDAVAPIISNTLPPAPRQRTRRQVGPRDPGRRAALRAERDRESLYYYHPELRTIWADFKQRPKIEVKEHPQPDGLSRTLLPFQREGLNWLIEQEKSEFRGGILADEMGMGKTIQTIALMMTDLPGKTNLVVAPAVAIMQWSHEIEKFTNGKFKVFIFHGTTKTNDIKELKSCNVVLTTYNLLESIYRKQQFGFKRKNGLVKEKSSLHKIHWHRVILDEAHNIKDRACNTAKAVFALQTDYKLCLSGTPLQNRIGELFSLLRFLTADPFAYYYCRKCDCKDLHWSFKDNRSCDKCKHSPMSHLCFFNYDCLKPIQNFGHEGEGQAAFNNIHTLMKHIMLRRTKHEREEDLGLPPKVVKIRRDRFSEEELDLYDSIYTDSKRKFDTYVAQGVVLNNYANIFTLITRMRQMADHPDLVLRRHSEEGQNTFVCVICDDEAEDAIQSRCHHTFCRSCAQQYENGYNGDTEPDCPRCHVTLNIDLTQPAMEVDALTTKKHSIINRIDMSQWRSSTKIEALCEELWKLREPCRTTKSIVFSQYTSMLQLVEWRLKRAGFKTVMLEGSMSPGQRDSVIKYFMENVDVEVFLVSLKAGGVALNLIEANRVFILDPWWNPATENQAMDRIHRIGQVRMCTTVRLVIEDSIESRIVELQEKKARMFEATVNADAKAMERLSPGDMQFLFQN